MKLIKFFLLSLVLLMSSSLVHAQSSLEGFSTGRYEIRPTKKKNRLPTAVEETEENDDEKPVTDSDGIKVRVLTPKQLADEKAKEAAAKAKLEADKAAAEKLAADKAAAEKQVADAKVLSQNLELAKKEEQATVEDTQLEEPTIGEQAESLFNSSADKVYDYYAQKIHPDDIRNNKVEIEFAPVVAYNDSKSDYSFRNYNAFFEAMKIKAGVWLTPLIGVSGQILFSFGADVDDANHSKVSAKYENLDLALNFRKFFGVSRKANSLEFSVLYSDDQYKVSEDSQKHPRLHSSGLGVGLKARFPTSLSYAWTVGGTFFPRLAHNESATAVDVSSGSSDENTRIGFDLGGEWKFSRYSQMTWNMGVSSERNLFSGPASLPDPQTGNTPINVSVTNTMYMFNLGYRLGH